MSRDICNQGCSDKQDSNRTNRIEKRDTLQTTVGDFDLEPEVQVGVANSFQAYRLAVMLTKRLQLLPG